MFQYVIGLIIILLVPPLLSLSVMLPSDYVEEWKGLEGRAGKMIGGKISEGDGEVEKE